MKRIIILNLFCIVLILGLLNSNSFAEQVKSSQDNKAKITEVGVLDFPPFYVITTPENVSGSFADLLRNILKKADIKYNLIGYPAKRLYQNLAQGKTHLFLGIKGVPDYENNVLYSKASVLDIILCVYTIGDVNPLPKTKDELKEKDFIVIRGYGYAGLINFLTDPKNNIKIQETSSHESAFKMIEKGRGKYVLDYKQPAEEFLQTYPIKDLKFNVLVNIPTYFIVPKSFPNAQEFLDKIEKTYEEIKNVKP